MIELRHAQWRKASASTGNNACVEVADLPSIVAVRDSKNPDGPALAFTRAEWSRFTRRAKDSDFS